MSDLRKTLQQLDEMTAGATGSGSIAGNGLGFANGIGEKTRRRVEEETVEEWYGKEEKRDSNWPLGTTVKDVRKKTDKPSNFGMWANSPSKNAKQQKVKSMKVVESSEKNVWDGIGFDVRSDYLWPTKLWEMKNTKEASEFSEWLSNQQNKIPRPSKGKKCILAMIQNFNNTTGVIYGFAKFIGETDTHYILEKLDTETQHQYSKKEQIVFPSKKTFDHFILMLGLKTDGKLDIKQMPVMESSVKINEADLEEEKLEPKDKKTKSDMVDKKKADKRDLSKKPKDKDILPKTINESADELEAALTQARNITKQIKYDSTVMDIITQIRMLAEKYGVDVESEINDVYDASNALESAVYGLEQEFEYAAKQARWKEEEEQDEQFNESPHGVSQNTKLVLEARPADTLTDEEIETAWAESGYTQVDKDIVDLTRQIAKNTTKSDGTINVKKFALALNIILKQKYGYAPDTEGHQEIGQELSDLLSTSSTDIDSHPYHGGGEYQDVRQTGWPPVKK